MENRLNGKKTFFTAVCDEGMIGIYRSIVHWLVAFLRPAKFSHKDVWHCAIPSEASLRPL
jgi:hypothetical protein